MAGAEDFYDPGVVEEEASLQTVKARKETGVPLETVTHQTVGEIQRHIQGKANALTASNVKVKKMLLPLSRCGHNASQAHFLRSLWWVTIG